MRKYLAELYLARREGLDVDAIAASVRTAAEEISTEGTHVVLLQSIYVPDDETWFCLFEVEFADAVERATRRAGLACERIVPAECLPGAGPVTSGVVTKGGTTDGADSRRSRDHDGDTVDGLVGGGQPGVRGSHRRRAGRA